MGHESRRCVTDEVELFRALRSGLRPHTRSGGYAADSIGRYALTQSAGMLSAVSDPLSPIANHAGGARGGDGEDLRSAAEVIDKLVA